MDCAKSLTMLSDFQAGMLNEPDSGYVRAHLSTCATCLGVFQDLDSIISAAALLRDGDGVSFPDEEVFWQRLSISGRVIH